MPPATGFSWVGYVSSAVTLTGGAQLTSLSIELGLPAAADGSPFTGPFLWRAIVGQIGVGFDPGGCSAPSSCFDSPQPGDLGAHFQQNVSDFRVMPGSPPANPVAPGQPATVSFNVRYIDNAGFGALKWSSLVKTLAFIPLAPVIGAAVGFSLMLAVYWIFRNWRPAGVDRLFRRGQLFSAAAYSLGHGGNDAQKTMGVILALLIASGHFSKDVKLDLFDLHTLWIILACHAAMALGTAFGGWRIVRTMGMKITKLRPVGGFCAETSGAFMLFFATWASIPVSTTHTITGSIIGVGATRKLAGIRWGVAGRIVWAWILTIPASAAVAAGMYALLHLIRHGI